MMFFTGSKSSNPQIPKIEKWGFGDLMNYIEYPIRLLFKSFVIAPYNGK